MSSPTMMDFLMEQLSGSAMQQMTRQTGGNQQATQQAIRMLLPMLMSALARNASSPDGAEALSGALQRDHDGSLLEDVLGYVGSGGDIQDGNAILKHILGGQRNDAERAVSKSTGLDPAAVTQLITMLAPLVLAYLGKQQRQQALDPGGLSDFLIEEQSHIESDPPAELGGLAGLLDADHDGDVTDDAARIGMGLLQKWLRGRSG